jgi:hypothetical protein
MPKWSSRSAAFKVKIYYTPKGRGQITIPKPLLDGFDRPDLAVFRLVENGVRVDFTHSVSKNV